MPKSDVIVKQKNQLVIKNEMHSYSTIYTSTQIKTLRKRKTLPLNYDYQNKNKINS